MSLVTSKDKMDLDLAIVGKIHSLKTLYSTSNEYNILMNEVLSLLKKQKKIDFKNYQINLRKNINIHNEVKKAELENGSDEHFQKLSTGEKQFIKKHNYDYLTDKYNLFNTKSTPVNDFTEEWRDIQIRKNSQSLHDFYKDRDWT